MVPSPRPEAQRNFVSIHAQPVERKSYGETSMAIGIVVSSIDALPQGFRDMARAHEDDIVGKPVYLMVPTAKVEHGRAGAASIRYNTTNPFDSIHGSSIPHVFWESASVEDFCAFIDRLPVSAGVVRKLKQGALIQFQTYGDEIAERAQAQLAEAARLQDQASGLAKKLGI